MSAEYLCNVCGELHAGPPLSWGPNEPLEWARIPENERESRGECGTDQCVIDDDHFYVRGRLEIPVTDIAETFAWLVWVEVSPTDFFDMSDKWEQAGRERTPPYRGKLASDLPLYEPKTFGLEVVIHTRHVGIRPFIEVVQEHPLKAEQASGITSQRVQGIAEQLSH